METINGINFEDWAAAAANIANGMSSTEVLKVLGIESPVWEDTNKKWGEKLADLMTQDINIATTYGQIFANPKVGKFANVGSVASLESLLEKVPDYDSYQKIMSQQSKAAEVGLDPGAVLEENGINLQAWGQLNMHYSEWINEYMDSNTPDYNERFAEKAAIDEKWDQYWTNYYKDKSIDLGGDIDF